MYDRGSGQFLTGGFMNAMMPRAGFIPRITTGNEPLPTELNALGAKGVGEADCGGSPRALTNAVVDAPAALGIQHIDMPLT